MHRNRRVTASQMIRIHAPKIAGISSLHGERRGALFRHAGGLRTARRRASASFASSQAAAIQQEVSQASAMKLRLPATPAISNQAGAPYSAPTNSSRRRLAMPANMAKPRQRRARRDQARWQVSSRASGDHRSPTAISERACRRPPPPVGMATAQDGEDQAGGEPGDLPGRLGVDGHRRASHPIASVRTILLGDPRPARPGIAASTDPATNSAAHICTMVWL
jgi:hypothetical protein